LQSRYRACLLIHNVLLRIVFCFSHEIQRRVSFFFCQEIDPRLHFALVKCSASCPPLRPWAFNNFEKGLTSGTISFFTFSHCFRFDFAAYLYILFLT
jgi:hypothetical protein